MALPVLVSSDGIRPAIGVCLNEKQLLQPVGDQHNGSIRMTSCYQGAWSSLSCGLNRLTAMLWAVHYRSSELINRSCLPTWTMLNLAMDPSENARAVELAEFREQ